MSSSNNKSTEQHFSYQKDSNKDQSKDWNKDLNKDKDLHSNDLNKDLNKDSNKDWNKDSNKYSSGSDSTHHSVDADKNKVEKTSITFEKKKERSDDKDVDMKDKNTSGSSQKNEGKGFMETVKENIGTVKEKVKEALSSGDNDKDVQHKEKDQHIGAGVGYNKDKDVGMSGVSSSSNQYQHQSDLGASVGSQKYSSTEHDKLHSGGAAFATQDKPIAGGLHEKPVTGVLHEEKPITGVIYEKPAAGLAHEKPMPGAVRDNATIDHVGLGAEHREAGYDKNANVVADKNKDLTDIHAVGGIKTSTVGSSAGTTQGSFKTIESK